MPGTFEKIFNNFMRIPVIKYIITEIYCTIEAATLRGELHKKAAMLHWDMANIPKTFRKSIGKHKIFKNYC